MPLLCQRGHVSFFLWSYRNSTSHHRSLLSSTFYFLLLDRLLFISNPPYPISRRTRTVPWSLQRSVSINCRIGQGCIIGRSLEGFMRFFYLSNCSLTLRDIQSTSLDWADSLHGVYSLQNKPAIPPTASKTVNWQLEKLSFTYKRVNAIHSPFSYSFFPMVCIYIIILKEDSITLSAYILLPLKRSDRVIDQYNLSLFILRAIYIPLSTSDLSSWYYTAQNIWNGNIHFYDATHQVNGDSHTNSRRKILWNFHTAFTLLSSIGF